MTSPNATMLCSVFALVSSVVLARAEELLDESVIQGMYEYTVFNSEIDALVYWGHAIDLEILAPENEPGSVFAASHVYTTVFQYSNYARNPLRPQVGIPDIVYAGNTVSSGTNFFVGFVKGLDQGKALNAELVDPFDYTENDIVSEIVENNIQKVGSGCYGGWSVSTENVVGGFVLLIDEGLSEEEKVECSDYLLPFAFGVKPGGVFLSFDNEENTTGVREVFDSSSIGLRIQTAAACRIIGGDRTIQCAQEMLGRFYRMYGEVGGWRGP